MKILDLISQSEKSRIVLAYLQNGETLESIVAAMTPNRVDAVIAAIANERAGDITIGVVHEQPVMTVKHTHETSPKMVKMAVKISGLTDSLRETFELIQTKGPITNVEIFRITKSMRSTKITPGAVYARIVALINLGLVKSELAPGSKVTKVYSTDYVPTPAAINDSTTGEPTKAAHAALMALKA